MNKATEIITLNIVLEYIYSRFIMTLLFCIVGIVISEYVKHSSKKNYKVIPIGSMMIRGVVSGIVMCAVMDYLNIPFALYVLICLLMGIWSESVVQLITNVKFMKNLIVNFIGLVSKSNEIADAIKDTVEQMDEEDDKKEDTEDNNSG